MRKWEYKKILGGERFREKAEDRRLLGKLTIPWKSQDLSETGRGTAETRKTDRFLQRTFVWFELGEPNHALKFPAFERNFLNAAR
jgi:hypothetical protein